MKIPAIPEQVSIDALVASAVENASIFSSEFIPTEPEKVSSSGGSFTIPMLLPIGKPTGDGRKFAPGSLTTRDLPIPLLWQFKTDSGHNQSVIVGRIDDLDITENGAENLRGVFDVNPYAREAERMVRGGFLKGVSGDLDNFVGAEEEETLSNGEDPKTIKNKQLTITEARLMGATLVALPAFQEAYIKMDDEVNTDEESLPDGEYVNGELKETEMSLVASAAPLNPPREWFQHFKTSKPYPLTIDDDGRVHGYLALWSSSHIGMRGNTRPPRSASDYAHFRNGVVRTADGTDVTTGSITLVGGHAPLQASATQAAAHYDNTQSGIIDVSAGEDKFGIWLAGSLRPDVTPEQIRAARASSISGDWRNINGRLELVRICFVNTSGFPITRSMVSSGSMYSLVAAGAPEMHELSRQEAEIAELKSRLSALETKPIFDEAYEVFKADIEKQLEESNSKYEEALSVFGVIDPNKQIEESAKIFGL